MPSTSPPNILLIMADQLAAPFLSVHGHPVTKTPALDRLADQGVVFDSAYSNSPLCAPARFSMMSGQLNSKIGAYDNASEFPAAVPTFAHHLRRGGYQTCLSGKMHFVGPDQLHGFEERLTTDIYPADFGWTPNWEDPGGRFDWWFHNMDSVMNAGVAEATNQLDFDDEVGFHAVRKLRDLARTSDDRPWFLTASFTHPHDPYVMRRAYWDRYDHDEIDLPVVWSIPDAELDPHSRRLRNVCAMNQVDITEREIRNARHAYYASISYIDDWVGYLSRVLHETGMADDTVIIFTSDHGDMLGERGLWYKMSFFEHASRVPLIVSAPGRFSPRHVADHVSLLDILPTLVDLAAPNSATPDAASTALGRTIDGSSLIGQLEGDTDSDRTVIGEYLGEGAVAPIFMIRRGDHKFIHSDADPPQLFDLRSDPRECTNLALDGAYADAVQLFTNEIDQQWDSERIHGDVLRSQRARRVVDAAMRAGAYSGWDYVPTSDAANQYMRNHLDLNRVESDRRLS